VPINRIQFNGMNNLSPDYSVPLGKARNIVNCDVDDYGNVQFPRQGSTKVYAGADCHSWFSHETDTILGFFVEGNELKSLNSDLTVTALKTVGNSEMSYCRLGDTVFFSNGAVSGRYKFGTVFEWGVDNPPIQPTAMVTQTGGLYAGEHLVAITWLSNGEESGSVNARVVTVQDGGGIRLSSFPVPPSYVDSVAVYVSSVNGADLYLYDEYPATIDEVSIRYFVGTIKLEHQFIQKVKPGLGLTVHNGRIYWRDGTLIRFTDAHRYGAYSAFNYVPFEDVVTNIVSVPSVLFVTTKRAIYRVDSIDTDQMSLITVKTFGAVVDSVCYDDTDKTAYVMTDNGFVVLASDGAKELHGDQVIPPMFDRGTTAILSQNGFRKLVFVGQNAKVSALQHPDYSASEVARKGNNL